MLRIVSVAGIVAAALISGSASSPPHAPSISSDFNSAWANRLTWGMTSNANLMSEGPGNALQLERTLKAHPGELPPEARAQIAAMRISKTQMPQLVEEMENELQSIRRMPDNNEKLNARKAHDKSMNDLAEEARYRFVLRAIYSPDQLREQMTWFWINHFNVYSGKDYNRAMIGNYEDTIRDRAFGKFRDLLDATLHHPAMLRYLDNDQNAVGHINENYAREIMELHTMGADAGYSQKDVQELARILTGVGVRVGPGTPQLKPQWRDLYIRAGLFEFNPARHDFGDKHFLGHVIKGSGFGEVEQALDILAKSPATAKKVSTQLATYFMGDMPRQSVIKKMAQTFQRTEGDIAEVILTMARTQEFSASLGKSFKNPVQYVISALRLAYGDRVIRNPQPVVGWIRQLGASLYDRQTPEGYSMNSGAWSAPGQMATRFDVAKRIGDGSANLFGPATKSDPPAFPNLRNLFYHDTLEATLGQETKAALAKATSAQEWNMLLLSSPEFMYR
ncbi:DUF1800 domain-containing protein [Sphingobium sp. LF-16]|uniref:DUF1800 domain-containing protein n=1 Tax=Sphingobium sp. LF-16 TaxID=2185111 RepID=UPI000F0929C2|nr:DUF1800 domain-containing protein [Sphingobium sp. LF-16]